MKSLFLPATVSLIFLTILRASAAAPIATTGSSVNMTWNGATVGGSVNPRSASTKVWFQWGLTTNYGNLSATQTLSSGNSAVFLQQDLTNLVQSNLYHFRIVASNSSGVSNGADSTFTVLRPPVVTNIMLSRATLTAVINPNSPGPWSSSFQWGTTTNYGFTTPAESQPPGDTNVLFQHLISDLVPGTTYHFRMWMLLNIGYAYSSDVAFTTLTGGPHATTLFATNIGPTTAILSGSANPNGLETTVWFRYYSLGRPIRDSASQNVGAGSNVVSITALATNLDVTKNAYFRLVASNSSGEVVGNELSFTTLCFAETLPPTSTDSDSTVLQATIRAEGQAVGYRFDWEATNGADGGSTPYQYVSNTSPVVVQFLLTNLLPVTTYRYRCFAIENSLGLGSCAGAFTEFVTPAVVITGNATNITTNSVTLTGSVNPSGLATTAYFQWGLTTNYGNTTPGQPLGAGNTALPVEATLLSLLTYTNYHYRMTASNASGLTFGNDRVVTPTLLLYLYPGESWSYVFHDLPFYTLYTLPDRPQTRASFTFVPGSFAPGSAVQFEMFADSLNDGPSFSTVVTNSAGGFVPLYPNTMWLDGQGAVRLTMLTGSVVVSSMLFQQFGFSSGSGAPWYRNEITTTKFPQPPLFGTQFVSSVSIHSAAVGANINVKNLLTGLFVQWGTTTNYGFASGAALLDRDYFITQNITVSNLAAGTVYHLRFVATNSAGATYGNDLTLNTPGNVFTQPANNRTTTSAVLNATVIIDGLTTTAHFEWGTTTNYGQVTALQNLGDTLTTATVAASITGLFPQTTYHYRAVAFSAGVTNRGNDLAFATTGLPTNFIVTNLVSDDVRGAIERGGQVTFACDGVLVLSNQIEIVHDVCLDATGHAITLSGGNSNRIFNVLPGVSLTLTNITLANGRSTNGGAIHNEGTVIAQGCQFLSNAAIGANGVNGTNGATGVSSFTASQVTPGAPGQDGGPGQDASGGAIYNTGTLDLTACLFVNDAAIAGKGGKGGNGGNGGAVLPDGVRWSNGGNGGTPGAAGTARGGSIASLGPLLLRSCVFSNSIAFGGEGGGGGTMGIKFGSIFGVTNGAPAPTNGLSRTGAIGGVVQGGAVFSAGTCIISNSFFLTNATFGGLGGTGAVLPTCQYFQSGMGGKGGQAEGGAIFIASNSLTARFADCTFAANRSAGGAGGSSGTYIIVSPMSICSFFNGADGGDASGGAVRAYGECLVVRCLFSSNRTVGGNGSLADEIVPRGGTGGTAAGGAICVASNGMFANCTFDTNVSIGGAGGAGGNPRNTLFGGVKGGNGGNAYGGGLFASQNAAVTNLTFDHNAAIRGSATTNASPSQNGVLGNSYGGSMANTSGVIQIVNTIIAFGSDSNSFGNIADFGNNLSSDITPAWTSGTSVNNTDPLLLPLANNGGPTLTMALRAGSPALNAANCSSAPVTDQRGYARPSGPGCDVGAYEGPGTTSLQILRQNSSTNVLRWLAEAGQVYRLEITADFTGWTPYATNTAGANGWLDFPVPANLSPRFFRLLAQ